MFGTCWSEISPDLGALRFVTFPELFRQVSLLRQHRDEMHGQKRGNREQRNPEIVDRQAKTDLEEGDSEIHGISCEAVGTLQNELGRGLPGSGVLARAHEKR